MVVYSRRQEYWKLVRGAWSGVYVQRAVVVVELITTPLQCDGTSCVSALEF